MPKFGVGGAAVCVLGVNLHVQLGEGRAGVHTYTV